MQNAQICHTTPWDMSQGCGLSSWAVSPTGVGGYPFPGPSMLSPGATRMTTEWITMTTPSLASSVHPLLPYEVQPGRLLLASGVRAGDWIFASGLLPTRFGSAARPLSGRTRLDHPVPVRVGAGAGRARGRRHRSGPQGALRPIPARLARHALLSCGASRGLRGAHSAEHLRARSRLIGARGGGHHASRRRGAGRARTPARSFRPGWPCRPPRPSCRS